MSASPEDIDRVCQKLAVLWKLCPDRTLGEVLHEPSNAGVLGRFYGWTRTDRWPHHMTDADFEECLNETIHEKERALSTGAKKK